jgi:hypothetical protein
MRSPLALLVAASLVLGACATAPVPPPPDAGATLDAFEGPLAPYGDWVVLGRYGRVWRPHVAGPWQPYLHGEWAWTDDGWFWVTDEPWGWATYHYGRWGYDPALGWFWVPGTEWGPAWVAWRTGDGFVGWAPLLPDSRVWWNDPYHPVGPPLWVFVPVQSFVGVPITAVAAPPRRVPDLVRATRPAPPRSVRAGAPPLGGPPRPFVEREAGRPIPPVRIVPAPSPADARGPVERGAVPVYRPAPGAHPPGPKHGPARTAPASAAPPVGSAPPRGAPAPATREAEPPPAREPARPPDERTRTAPPKAVPPKPAPPPSDGDRERPAPPRPGDGG